ncbi:MAG: type II secretion system protein [Sedimentisphaerales bacterium]|nr:type II secretion system protein [Sedimentisphaerales bacterium]
MRITIINFMFNRAFTLVEILIVVSIIGILAAIVVPEYQNHAQQAAEAAAKENLRILREAIERYTVDHNGIPPGYPDNDTSQAPTGIWVYRHLVDPGEYLTFMPINPFKNNHTINVSATPLVGPDGENGWIYYPPTRDFHLNQPGVDSKGISYFDY